MVIDISELNSNTNNEISINDIVSFDNSYIDGSGIKELNDIEVKGRLYKDNDDSICLNAKVKGKMLIEDSISLDDVYYPFDIEIDENVEENIENSKNSIDILEVLWQNIVLEIPIRYTTVSDYKDINGDGWKLVHEDEVSNSNNPFKELSEKMKEE